MAEKYCFQIEELSLSSDNYVLVIPGWYPTWQDRFEGDFNQRHVLAAGLHTSQVVLYIVKDQSKTLSKIETRYKQVNKSVVEITVMYPEVKNKWIDVLHSNLLYIQLLFKYAEMIKKQWGKPLLIHSYIVIRGGVGGMLLGKKWQLPFILSENWTIYYPTDPGSLYNRNFLFRWAVRKVFKNVKRFLPVSYNLRNQVENLYGSIPSDVVPNTVETGLFLYEDDQPLRNNFKFIHISAMTYQKNPEGLLRCFKRFVEIHHDCSLCMVGPYSAEVLNYARKIGLSENLVTFTGAVSYNAVAKFVKTSNALVLFSRYENLPCVILEALCCGVPVITTSVGGIPEVINSNNGILVNSENEEELTAAFAQMYKNYQYFDRKRIADEAVNLYSYSAVAGLINNVYHHLFSLQKEKMQLKN